MISTFVLSKQISRKKMISLEYICKERGSHSWKRIAIVEISLCNVNLCFFWGCENDFFIWVAPYNYLAVPTLGHSRNVDTNFPLFLSAFVVFNLKLNLQ